MQLIVEQTCSGLDRRALAGPRSESSISALDAISAAPWAEPVARAAESCRFSSAISAAWLASVLQRVESRDGSSL